MRRQEDSDDRRIERGRRRVRDERITLAHGAGGKAMRDLIDDVFVGAFDNALLAPLEDQARLCIGPLAELGDRLAFTTDSYVIDPLFFPGGDIGSLAVNGTVNDLAVSGARALFLTCSVIIEEGFEVERLREVARSMARAADFAQVRIVTGDTKVVPRGAADGLFINTAGVGVIRPGIDLRAARARPGDVILTNGTLGDHGAAVLAARQDLGFGAPIESDCRALNALVDAMLGACPDIHCLRDATRGGFAAVLNELAAASGVCMRIEQARVPLNETVKAVCEILGLDPLHMANEGKLVAVVPRSGTQAVLSAMRAEPAGRDAAVIGEVLESPAGMVVLATAFGGERVLDMLVGEQLPRIC